MKRKYYSGDQTFKPAWKQDRNLYGTTKINSHTKFEDRVLKKKKQKSTLNNNQQPVPVEITSNLLHSYRTLKRPDHHKSIYNTDFQAPGKACYSSRIRQQQINNKQQQQQQQGIHKFSSPYGSTFETQYSRDFRGSYKERRKKIQPPKETLSLCCADSKNSSYAWKSGYMKDYEDRKIGLGFQPQSTTKDLQSGLAKGNDLYGSKFMGHVSRFAKGDKNVGSKNFPKMFKKNDGNRVLSSREKAKKQNEVIESFVTKKFIPGYSGHIPKSKNNLIIKLKKDNNSLSRQDYKKLDVDPQITKKHGISNLTLKQFFVMDGDSGDGLAAAHRFYSNNKT